MNIYQMLFQDSFLSAVFFMLNNESLWFAAKDFGVYNMLTVTLICYAGSVLGILVNILLGYGITSLRGKMFNVDEELFARLSKGFSKYGIYILLFQMLPFVKVFFFFAGLFAVPFRRLLAVLLVGRAAYYLYYLYVLPRIPSIVY